MVPIWYTLIVVPGYEEFVKKTISSRKDLFCENVLISKMFSGYVFVKTKIELGDLSKFFEIEGTVNFLGKKYEIINGKNVMVPEEISKKQIEKIISSIENVDKTPVLQQKKYKVGDKVIIRQGDLSGIYGIIIDLKKKTVKIQTSFFKNHIKLVKTNVKDIELL